MIDLTNKLSRICTITALIGLVTSAYAQAPPPSEAPTSDPGQIITPENNENQETGEDLISMTVNDAKLQDVLQLLGAMRPGVNIIMGSGIEGTVPLLTIQDSEFEEALNMVAEACDLTVRKEGEKTYRVEQVVELLPGALHIELVTPVAARELPIQEVRRLLGQRHVLDGLTEPELRQMLAENASDFIMRLSVTEASAVEVVNEIARKGELNFAFSPGTGRQNKQTEEGAPRAAAPQFPNVTLNLRLMSVVDALKMVSAQGNLSCTQKNGVWVVAPLPPEKMQREPVEMATFSLQFISIDAELLEMCRTLISNRGSVSRGKNRVLVVRDVAEGVDAVRTALQVMDRPTPQVLIEARFFELSDSFSEHLGVEWNTLGEDGLRISTGPYSESEEKQRIEQQAWQDPTSSSSTTTTNTTNTDLATGAITGSVSTNTTDTSTEASKIADTVQKTATHSATSAILDIGQLSTILHALRTTDGAKQLSNPKVVVASDEQATIHIGDQTPIVKSTTEGETGIRSSELDGDFGGEMVEAVDLVGSGDAGGQLRRYNTPKGYLDLGTKLTVAPSVKTENEVYIKVMPELVTLTGFETTASGDRYPQLFTTRVNTEFTIKSGQTIAIGGLVNERERDSESKVPVLGSLPLLGRAFRYSSTNKTKTETIIFLTVKIIPSEQLLTTSGIPIRAHMVQPEVDRIRREDAQGAEYDEQRARERMQQAIQEAEDRNWSLEKLREKLKELSEEDETDDGAEPEEIDIEETENTFIRQAEFPHKSPEDSSQSDGDGEPEEETSVLPADEEANESEPEEEPEAPSTGEPKPSNQSENEEPRN